ncbi:hypothetical protein BBOV_III004410 [Babesia bovis T2Bo]|uniref:Uncharacterized protein n=1 Tax=Babesia bovis TaxID=5865 RepID=A7AN70_BABBO|nr:hypothetical protein BBOV_III004410 [Babesia bovis T2Bo]EDO08004.1 hypothetical protein BBOV_III004410 [Babesia bovis T2Bo]|eukprot:XP_001611572.1 hypothetical protein [Babesia bovis T2Bo]
MSQYGPRSQALPSDVIEELERKYNTATPVKEGVVKIPAADPDVCGVKTAVESPAPSTTVKKADDDVKTPEEKAALLAKITGNQPNISPAYRLLADPKLCLKGNSQQAESLHRQNL